MCTGAEIPAAMAAAAGSEAAATAGTAAAADAAAASTAAAGTAAASAAAPEALATTGANLLGSTAPDVIGSSLPGGAGGAMDMFGTSTPSAWNLGIQQHPFAVAAQGLESATGIPFNSVGTPLMNTAGNALGNYSKAQTAINAMQPPKPPPAPAARPPSMNQQPLPPLAPAMGGLLGGKQQIPDGAKLMMLKRIGLLGSM